MSGFAFGSKLIRPRLWTMFPLPMIRIPFSRSARNSFPRVWKCRYLIEIPEYQLLGGTCKVH